MERRREKKWEQMRKRMTYLFVAVYFSRMNYAWNDIYLCFGQFQHGDSSTEFPADEFLGHCIYIFNTIWFRFHSSFRQQIVYYRYSNCLIFIWLSREEVHRLFWFFFLFVCFSHHFFFLFRFAIPWFERNSIV